MWTTLLSTAVAVGLPYAIDWIKQKIAADKQVTQAEILEAVSKLTNEARNKSNSSYNKLLSMLNANPSIYGASPAVKAYLTEASQKLQNRVQKAQNMAAAVENAANAIENRANSFSAEDVTYKLSHEGKQVHQGIINDANKLSQEVEKYV